MTDSPSSTKPIKRLDSLPRKKLGSSDLIVTELCAGTMTWGSFVKEEAEAHAQLDKLVELGVNFFDTAELYPVAYNYGETTERWMGNWLERRVAAGSLRREDVVIATKCNPAGVGSPEGTPHNFSLERLEASNDMSLNNRVYEGDIAEAAHQFGVVGLPYGALSGGVLTGKYLDSTLQSDEGRPLEVGRMRATPDFQPRYASPVSLAATAEYIALATKYGIKPLELAFAWARDRWYNAGVIPGFTTVAQVEACVEAFKLEPLPAALNEEVDAIHERYRNPCATYANKELVQTAPWLEDAMRPKGEL